MKRGTSEYYVVVAMPFYASARSAAEDAERHISSVGHYYTDIIILNERQYEAAKRRASCATAGVEAGAKRRARQRRP